MRQALSTSGLRTEPTDIQKLGQPGLVRIGGSQQAYIPMEAYARLGKHIRDKVHFDLQPTDLQNDIKGTDNCEIWNRQVGLIIPPPVQGTTHDSEQYDTASQPPQAEDWLTKLHFPSFRPFQR
jgi:hypothetical protein